MDDPREYLVGFTSMKEGFIDAGQFKEALSTWREQPDRSMGVILVERGWLSEAARSTVEGLVEAKLARLVDLHPSDLPSTAPVASDPDGTTTPRDMGEWSNGFQVDGEGSSQEAPPIGPPPDATEDVADRYPRPQYHASGGMKIVYRVKDRKLGRDIALAKLKPDLARNPEHVRRFVVEARLTAALGHPNIVPIHDLNERSTPPSYTMPFLEGRTFSAAIREHHARKSGDPAPEFSLRDLLTSFLGVCNAVAFAHGQGVIHRDLKGANVQIDTLGQTIVLDWGLAHRLSDTDDPLARATDPGDTEDDHAHTYAPTRAGSAIGTIQYIPPEQARGELDRIHKHSDIFGLGAMLYLILTGRPPYDNLKKAAAADFGLPSAHKPGVPKALEAICLKAMRAEPADRYESAEALAADVRRWLADEPVSVFPEPATVRVFRWARKHRPIVAGAAMLLIAAVVGLGIGIWRVNIEREKVDTEREEKGNALIAAQNDAVLSGWLIDETRRLVADALPNLPHSEDFRLRVAALNTQFASDVLAHRQVVKPEDRLKLIRMLHEAANDYRNFGLFSGAAIHYARALSEVRTLLVDQTPQAPIYKELLSRILCDQAASLFLLGHPEPARPLLKESEELTASPSDPISHRAHSWVGFTRAELLRSDGNVDDAAKLLQEALDEFTGSFGPKTPAGLFDQFRIEWLRVGLGAALGRAGKTKEAVTILQNAIEKLTKLYDSEHDHNYAFIICRSRFERGKLLAAEVPARAEAIRELDQAIEGIERLSRDFPKFHVYRRALAQALTSRAMTRADASRSLQTIIPVSEIESIEADAGYARDLLTTLVCEICESDFYHGPLGDATAQLGRAAALRGRHGEAIRLFGEAVEHYGRAQKFAPKDPEVGLSLQRCQDDLKAETARGAKP